jgi:hypothetical protein
MMRDFGLDILAVTETWLVPVVASSFVGVPGYAVVRGDTESGIRKHGACLYVAERLKFLEVNVDCPNACAVHLLDFDIRVISIYRPPSSTALQDDILVDCIIACCQGMEAVLLGDFNLPTLNWAVDIFSNYISPSDKKILNCFDSLGLVQWVTEPTITSGNILDLVLTTDPDRVGSVEVLPPLPCCGHSPVLFDYVFVGDVRDRDSGGGRLLWQRGDYDSISGALSSWDWDYEFDGLTVNDNYTLLSSILMDLVARFVPSRDGNAVPWSRSPPGWLSQLRSDAWSRYKSARAVFGRREVRVLEALENYKEVNFRYRNFEVFSRCNYEESLIRRINVAPKLFHSYIRHKKVSRPTVGPLKLPCGRLVVDSIEMAEVFAQTFSSVYVTEDPINPAILQFFPGHMERFDIGEADVVRALSVLDGSSSSGPDGVHPMLLKSCCSELAHPLSVIFNKSLLSGSIPLLWSKSLVVPLFKAGSRFDPSNYRPVSLTSVCCKTMERVIAARLVAHLEENCLLSPDQFGFRSGRSTEDQLLLTYGEVAERVDSGYVVDVVLLDFSKAFDVVCHSVLLQKLVALGVDGAVVQWIAAFLSNRKMSVVCDGVVSGSRDVGSGVPQGSVLGPILFLIYVNHIVQYTSCSCKAFADDFKLYLHFARERDYTIVQGVRALQRDLNSVSSVSGSWNLRLNQRKCVVMRFGGGNYDFSSVGVDGKYYLDGVQLEFVDSWRDLGVIVDVKLRFHEHVRTAVNKAAGLANNLLRSTVNRSPIFMKTLFISHIRPILDYCSCVYNVGYLGDSRSVESVQRRWTGCVEGLGELDYAGRLQALDLFSMSGRRLRSDLIKIWKIFHSGDEHMLVLFNVNMARATRGHNFKLVVPHCRADIKKRSFHVRSISLWNSLPADVVESTSIASFKSGLVASLGPLLFHFD